MTVRKQHYMFAHRLLPEVAYKDPAGFYKIIGSGAGQRFLSTLWEKAADMIKRPSIPSEGLHGQMLGSRLAVIELPRPLTPPESYFALFASVRGANRMLILPGALKHYYYTLEMGPGEGEAALTNLCSLDPDCNQDDLGSGTAARKEAFVEAVMARLNKA